MILTIRSDEVVLEVVCRELIMAGETIVRRADWTDDFSSVVVIASLLDKASDIGPSFRIVLFEQMGLQRPKTV